MWKEGLVIRLIVLWSQGSNNIIIDVKMLRNHHAQTAIAVVVVLVLVVVDIQSYRG